jgi:hypothetical protein
LLQLHGAGGGRKTARQLNDTFRSNLESVKARLNRLVAQGLVACEGPGDDCTYRYAPATPELGQLVDRLALMYKDYRVRIIDLIFSPPDRLRSFSDAFRLTKEEDDSHA